MSNQFVVPINDLSRIDNTDRSKILGEFESVLQSGQFFNGPKTQALENRLSKLFAHRSFVFVGNGTDAIAISLISLGIKPGDKVCTVANAGGYATGAILRIGATPLLVDVDPGSAQMNVEALKRIFEKHLDIRAVVVTHLYGLMAQIRLLAEITRDYGAKVIEDCAQSFGAISSDQYAGTFGDASTFSFYPTKNLAGIGDGGAISFQDEKDAMRAKRIAQYGWTDRYVVSDKGGVNSRLDELQAAVILNRLEYIDEWNSRRREIVAKYQEALSGNRRVVGEYGGSFVAHLAVLITPTRDDDQNRLDAEMIQTSIHYPVLDHHQPAWQEIFLGVKLPESERLVDQILTLPCFPQLKDSEIDHVCNALGELRN